MPRRCRRPKKSGDIKRYKPLTVIGDKVCRLKVWPKTFWDFLVWDLNVFFVNEV